MKTLRTHWPFLVFAILGGLCWGALAVFTSPKTASLWTVIVSALALIASQFAGREEHEMPVAVRNTHDIYEVVEHFVPGAETWVHSYRGTVTVEVGGSWLCVIPAYRRRLEKRITDALQARGVVGTEWKVVCR